jgi:hypothetical protein
METLEYLAYAGILFGMLVIAAGTGFLFLIDF